MVDYTKLTEVMKDAYGNEPVEIILMQQTPIRIYPGGKIFPGKPRTWIQGINIVKQRAKPKTKDLQVENEVGEKKAW